MSDTSLGGRLVGSWELISFELQFPDGTVTHPFGTEVRGYLFYNQDGFMCAAFGSAARAGSNEKNLAEVGAAAGYDQFMAYTGPYRVEGDRIIHHVEVSSLEAWTGSVQERWYKIDGERLTLHTAPLVVGSDAPTGALVWDRVTRGVTGGKARP